MRVITPAALDRIMLSGNSPFRFCASTPRFVDQQLGDAYRAFRDSRSGSARDVVLQSQRDWVQLRDASCPVTFNAILDGARRQSVIRCLLAMTTARISHFK